jgi:hypothetical protein
MSVDKFGRYSEIGGKPGFHDKDCGLPLTSEGDYNIGNKRLRFVKNPEDSSDAINLSTLNSKTSNVLRLEGNVFNAKNYRIGNIANPIIDQDSVTKGYLDKKCLKLEGDAYNAKNYRIASLANPKGDQDAVSKGYLDTNVLKLEGAAFNAKNHRISNIAYPENDQDSVTKGYLETIIPKKHDDHFSFYNFVINDIGEPRNEGDAVNLKYVKENCITYGDRIEKSDTLELWSSEDKKRWDAKGKRIVNIPPGISKYDCAIVDQVPREDNKKWSFKLKRLSMVAPGIENHDCVTKDQTMTFDRGLNGYDAKYHRISNIIDPTQLQDVVNVNFIVRVLSQMFFDLYNDLGANKINQSEKDNWIRSNIVNKYFINPKSKLLRNNEED